jgi:hypothetical protein
MHSFTTEDLIQYIYRETSQQKTAAIKVALESDWSIRDKFDEIMSAYQGLEELNLSPRKKAVDNILAYAEKSVRHLTTEV